MKIAITCRPQAKVADAGTPLDPRFGRAGGFVVYDSETGSMELLDNTQNLGSPQGAGIQAAKIIINAGASAVITGNVGPKAYSTLSAGKVEIFLCEGGTVGEAIEEYRKGTLQKASGANVEGHW